MVVIESLTTVRRQTLPGDWADRPRLGGLSGASGGGLVGRIGGGLIEHAGARPVRLQWRYLRLIPEAAGRSLR